MKMRYPPLEGAGGGLRSYPMFITNKFLEHYYSANIKETSCKSTP